MTIRKILFCLLAGMASGMASGQENVDCADLQLYTLRHPISGMTMSATNYGARIVSLTPYGTDVVLGFDNLCDYVTNKQNLGALVGRYIGRIIKGHLEIDGVTYPLQLQGSGDCGHGGNPNFGGRVWDVIAHNDTVMTMRYISPDGENGFPGRLTVDVTYTLSADALRIDYAATTDKPTVFNPTNHSFFNLSADHSKDVLSEVLWMDCDSLALYDENKRVTGKLGCVKGTAFDFSTPHAIGDSIDADNFQLSVTKGYDHCYQLKNAHYAGGPLSKPVATLHDNGTGLTMEVYTTEPAMQIYTANGHKGNMTGKGGKVYYRRNAICFETMHYPDSPNQPQWPSTLLRPGETFCSTTVFRFRQSAVAVD